MLASDEVRGALAAVALALAVVGEAALLGFLDSGGYEALAVMAPECRAAPPPVVAAPSTTRLCIVVENESGSAGYYKVVYRVEGDPGGLPTRSSPGAGPALAEWRVAVADGGSAVLEVEAPVPAGAPARAALVFELWRYEEGEGWVYTGVWAHFWAVVQVAG